MSELSNRAGGVEASASGGTYVWTANFKCLKNELAGGGCCSVGCELFDLVECVEEEVGEFFAFFFDRGCPAAGFFEEAVSFVAESFGFGLESCQLCG